MKPMYVYGLSAGVLLGVIAWLTTPSIANAFGGDNPAPGGTWIWLLRTGIIALSMYMVVKAKIAEDEYLSFGQVYRSAYSTSLVALVAYVLTAALYFYLINPNWFPYSPGQIVQLFENKLDGTNVDMDELTPTINWMVAHMGKLVLFSIAFLNLIAYAVLSVVFATVMSKDNPKEIKL